MIVTNKTYDLSCKEVTINLKPIMKKRKITPYRLSKITGIKTDTIYKYYNNNVYRIDLHNLAIICQALNCELADVLQYNENNNLNI